MFGSTVGYQDIYGGSDPLAGSTPYGQAVAAPDGASAQDMAAGVGGNPTAASTSSPAFSWVGMVALLVAIRVLYEYAD
jgi:hypothetical protein